MQGCTTSSAWDGTSGPSSPTWTPGSHPSISRWSPSRTKMLTWLCRYVGDPNLIGWVPLACLLKTNVVFTKTSSFFYVLSLSNFFLPLTPLSHIWCFNLTRVGNQHMGHRSGGLPSRSRPGRGTPGHGGLPPPRLRLVPRVAAAVAGGGPAGPPPGPLTGRRGRDRGEGGAAGARAQHPYTRSHPFEQTALIHLLNQRMAGVGPVLLPEG